jgi:sugar (pentulose or hexulose) kinase
MADIFGVPVVAMVEDEGAALGGALQAAWCVAIRDGNKQAKLAEICGNVVALNESTRCLPNKENVARYRAVQKVQDKLGLALRDVFKAQRALVAKM